MSHDVRVNAIATKDSLAAAVAAASKTSENYKGNIILASSALGWIVPSLITGDAATYSQSGNIITVTSTGHGMTAAQNGRGVYLIIGSGAAITGWFTNFTYIDANAFSCTSTISQTTSGGCSTNTSNITIPESIITVPGNLLGNNGNLQVNALLTCTSSANSKKFRVTTGSDTWVQRSGTTVTSFGVTKILQNRGIYNKQISTSTNTNQEYNPGSANASVDYTIDTSLDVITSATIACTAASEFVVLEHFEIIAKKHR